MTFESYLPRFAVARLLAWLSCLEIGATSTLLAIGRMRHELRGTATPIKPRLAGEIARARRGLFEHMLHERAPCCDETTFELVAAARAA